MSSKLAQILKQTKKRRKSGTVSSDEWKKLESCTLLGHQHMEAQKNLYQASKLSKAKVDYFLHQKNAHTKYRQVRKRFPRLKVVAYDINEIWSIDVAYVDKIAKFNNGVKYLLVAVDVLPRYLRVVPMRSKSAPQLQKLSKR